MTPTQPRTPASLTTALPTLTRVAASIPADQPARVEIGNYGHETTIRVQLVTADEQTGSQVADRLGIDPVPVRRPTSDKSAELSWTGDLDGWTVVMIILQFSYDLNAPAQEV